MDNISIIIFILGIINFLRLSILTTLTFFYDFALSKKRLLKNDIIDVYKPLVSIVIAAYNEDKVIKRTLDNVFKSDYDKIQVIVVNDGSKDNTKKVIKKFIKDNPDKKLIYVYQKNQGKAHALNNGMKNYAKGEINMSLDADSVLTTNAISNAVKYFRNPKVKALAANVKILPENSFFSYIQQIEYLMGYHLKKALTVGNMEYIIGGVGSMFRASTMKEVDYYATDTVTEDIDLTMKFVRLGNKENWLTYAENVVIYTEGTLSLKALFRQRFRWKFGRFQTFWKNKDLFCNKESKYTKFLTCVYLPFQLFSEITFLFDPLLIIYIAYLSLIYFNINSYFGMFVFLMFYTVIAIATDKESSLKRSFELLLLSPLSYFMFFVVSIVEYIGLIRCIVKWKEIIYAKEYNRCGWTPVARSGKVQVS
jgi:cellulose synthase/poly-beta-1,6-N-acetylglucosamine synthase-like glycosyltransferase